MNNPLLDALGYVGESLDKPGRAVRGLLGGRPEEGLAAIPFSDTLGLTDPANRVSGRALLEKLGVLSPKGEDEGFGLGDVAGIGTELALDPVNLLGGAALKKVFGLGKAAKASNAVREARLATGGMPEEIAQLTKVAKEPGVPTKVYHGTPNTFEKFDMAKMDPEALYGPGIYTTESPDIASEYAKKGAIDTREYLRRPGSEETLAQIHRQYIAPAKGFRSKFALSDIDRANAAQHFYGLNESEYDTLAPQLQAAIDKMRPHMEESFGQVSPSNVRMHYLDVRNPLDLNGQVPAQDLFRRIEAVTGERPIPGLEDVTEFEPQMAFSIMRHYAGGKENVPDLLRQLGFDAIQHEGGVRGGVPHPVHIALDPSQVYSPWLAPALRNVPSANPLLAALAGHNVGARGGSLV